MPTPDQDSPSHPNAPTAVERKRSIDPRIGQYVDAPQQFAGSPIAQEIVDAARREAWADTFNSKKGVSTPDSRLYLGAEFRTVFTFQDMLVGKFPEIDPTDPGQQVAGFGGEVEGMYNMVILEMDDVREAIAVRRTTPPEVKGSNQQTFEMTSTLWRSGQANGIPRWQPVPVDYLRDVIAMPGKPLTLRNPRTGQWGRTPAPITRITAVDTSSDVSASSTYRARKTNALERFINRLQLGPPPVRHGMGAIATRFRTSV